MKKYYLVNGNFDILNVYNIKGFWITCQRYNYEFRYRPRKDHARLARYYEYTGKVFKTLIEAKEYAIDKLSRDFYKKIENLEEERNIRLNYINKKRR